MGYRLNYKAYNKNNGLTHHFLSIILVPEEQYLSMVSAIYPGIYPIFLNKAYIHFFFFYSTTNSLDMDMSKL